MLDLQSGPSWAAWRLPPFSTTFTATCGPKRKLWPLEWECVQLPVMPFFPLFLFPAGWEEDMVSRLQPCVQHTTKGGRATEGRSPSHPGAVPPAPEALYLSCYVREPSTSIWFEQLLFLPRSDSWTYTLTTAPKSESAVSPGVLAAL